MGRTSGGGHWKRATATGRGRKSGIWRMVSGLIGGKRERYGGEEGVMAGFILDLYDPGRAQNNRPLPQLRAYFIRTSCWKFTTDHHLSSTTTWIGPRGSSPRTCEGDRVLGWIWMHYQKGIHYHRLPIRERIDPFFFLPPSFLGIIIIYLFMVVRPRVNTADNRFFVEYFVESTFIPVYDVYHRGTIPRSSSMIYGGLDRYIIVSTQSLFLFLLYLGCVLLRRINNENEVVLIEEKEGGRC